MSSIVERFMTDEFKVERSGPGRYVKGRYQAGPTETVIICGSLQPLSPRELKLVTEGNRLKQAYRLYSDLSPTAENAPTLGDSDRIKINGDTYRVISVEAWLKFDLTYFKSIVAREPEQGTDG